MATGRDDNQLRELRDLGADAVINTAVSDDELLQAYQDGMGEAYERDRWRIALTDAESDHLHVLAGTAPSRTGLHRRDVRPLPVRPRRSSGLSERTGSRQRQREQITPPIPPLFGPTRKASMNLPAMP